jgi:hypothetical protein
MTKDTKPAPKKNVRRRRKVRKRRKKNAAYMEDNPEVKAWCESFVKTTEDTSGFTPTPDQAIHLGGHVGSWHGKTRTFITGLREAFASEENVEFF